MKLGTGSNTELTQKYIRVKVKKNDMRTSHIKQISPIFKLIESEAIETVLGVDNAKSGNVIGELA